MFARVTELMKLSVSLFHLSRNGRRIWKLQEMVASGRKVIRPSDDPLGAMSAIRLKGQLEQFEQYKRNIEFGLRWLNYTEVILDNLEELIAKAKEIAVSQASDTANLDTRRASAAYIRGLREAVLQLANSTYEGRSVFSGLSGKEAYSSEGIYLGDQGGFKIAVAEGVLVQVNLTGPRVFGEGQENLIQYLDRLAQALEMDQRELVAQGIDHLEGFLNRVIEARSQLGSWYAQLEAYRNILEQRSIKVTEGLSEVVDCDIAQAITELSSRQLAYEATLLSTKRLFEETLISFLR